MANRKRTCPCGSPGTTKFVNFWSCQRCRDIDKLLESERKRRDKGVSLAGIALDHRPKGHDLDLVPVCS